MIGRACTGGWTVWVKFHLLISLALYSAEDSHNITKPSSVGPRFYSEASYSPADTSDGPEFNSQQCWIECQPCIRFWKLRVLFGNCSITIVRLAPCGVLFGPGGSVPGGRVSTVSSPGGPEAGRLEGSLRGSSGLRWSQQNSQPLTKSGKN